MKAIQYFLVLFFFSFLISCGNKKEEKTTQKVTTKKQPNIVFVMVDDCSAVEFSTYATKNHPSGNITPTIDNLAKNGLTFTTCWATPLCKSTRALLMSGKYGYKTGVYGNRLDGGKDNFATLHKPISKLLKENGYETAISGKWHLPGYAAEEAYGWDEYSLLGGYMTPYKKDIVWDGLWFSWSKAADTFYDKAVIGKNNQKYPALYWHGAVIENGELLPSDANTYAPDLNQKFALDFIKKDHKKPFFLYYPIVLPHDPWLATPDANNPGEKTKPGFSSLINRTEYYMSELITTLKENGLYENTILFFTGDNATLANGKGSCSEQGVRVPLIVAGGPVSAKGVTNELVDFSDMYPTLMEIAGVEMEKNSDLDGQSFYPLLTGKEYKSRESIFSYLDLQRTIRTKDYMMDGNGGIWKCTENGNILDYEPLQDNEETQAIRADFLAKMSNYKLPTESLFKKERLLKATQKFTWPRHHPGMLHALKTQDNWMNDERRMKE